jgi:hypothetical protein
LAVIYWTLKSVPELSHLPRQERGRAWRAVSWKTLRHWQFWSVFIGVILGAGASAFLALFVIWRLGGSSNAQLYGGLAAMLFVALPGMVASNQVMTNLARPYLRAYLAARSAP